MNVLNIQNLSQGVIIVLLSLVLLTNTTQVAVLARDDEQSYNIIDYDYPEYEVSVNDKQENEILNDDAEYDVSDCEYSKSEDEYIPSHDALDYGYTSNFESYEYYQDSISITFPTHLPFRIMIFENMGIGYIESDKFYITNHEEEAIFLAFENVSIAVSNSFDFFISSNEILPEDGNHIHMALVVLQHETSKNYVLCEIPIDTQAFQLEAGESIAFYFNGHINAFGDMSWTNTLVTVKVSYTFERVDSTPEIIYHPIILPAPTLPNEKNGYDYYDEKNPDEDDESIAYDEETDNDDLIDKDKKSNEEDNYLSDSESGNDDEPISYEHEEYDLEEELEYDQ